MLAWPLIGSPSRPRVLEVALLVSARASRERTFPIYFSKQRPPWTLDGRCRPAGPVTIMGAHHANPRERYAVGLGRAGPGSARASAARSSPVRDEGRHGG